MTKFNERTNTLLHKKYIWLCVRGELETGDRLLHIDPSSSDHSSTSFSFWLGLLHRGSLKVQSSLCATWLSIRHLVPN